MRNASYLNQEQTLLGLRWPSLSGSLPRRAVVGLVLLVSLLAFELFNFDTTQYALRNLLGNVEFAGLQWASILAIAFCSIDFAGLIRLFTPERGANEPREVWYLMGAWLLGATMNAIMTWWAVSLTLLNHDFGNEVLTREQLLRSVPIFVAVLVWLTRILFIGAFTVAGDRLFDFAGEGRGRQAASPGPAATRKAPPASQVMERPRPAAAAGGSAAVPAAKASLRPQPARPEQTPLSGRPAMPARQHSRIRQRPPRPNGAVRRVPVGAQARSRN